MRTVLITLIGPERTADLVVDADTAVSELLPSLIAAGASATAEADLAGWRLALMDKQPIALEHTLGEAGVLDGAVLVLRRETGERAGTAAPAAVSGAPAGSPLKRTQELLLGRSAPGSRRARLLAPLPEGALAPDAARLELEQAIARARLGRCATIAIVSPKGGVGKTTLSILLGELLSRLREDIVLALDADSDYGSLGRVAPARAAARPAAPHDGEVFDALAVGSLNFAELDRTLWKLPGGLRIVPSPRDPAGMARADRERYARALGHLQRLAGLLVVDCGTGLGQPGVQAAILACDQLVVVTDASGATASLAVEAMQLLERTGRPITIVANRLRRGRAGSDDLLRLDALFPRAAALVGVPDEPEAEHALRGDFDWETAPRTLRQGVVELAAALALSWAALGLEPAA